MTSQNFSSKRLSLDSLKVRDRCGLMSLAAHRRCTLAGEIAAARAIVRQLHRPRWGGGVTALLQHLLHRGLRQPRLAPAPGTIAQPLQPAQRKAPDPAVHAKPCDPQLLGDALLGQTLHA